MTIPVPQLTVTQLFTPTPSGVGQNAIVPPTNALTPPETWLSQMLQTATAVELPTTSWQPGAPERTIFAIEAVQFSLSDAIISEMAQGGFLQSAASGSVTYTTISGTTLTIPVTPDPSNAAQNPTGNQGYLDLLATNVYGVNRLPQSAAAGPLAIVNLKGTTVGPYGPLAYHVGNSLTGATYSNPASITIPSSAIAGSGGVVTGVTTGLTSTTIATAAPHGLAVNNVVYVSIPASAGIAGLAGVFALVTGATSTSIQIATGSSGAWTAGGNIYLCTTANMVADVAGIAGNAGPSTVTTAITQNAGVFVSNIVPWSGSNWESNVGLANRCVLSLAAASPNGASQAYAFVAETAAALLAIATPSYVLTNGPVSASEFATPSTGVITVVVASATPASTTLGANVTPGVAQLPITSITNANPGVVACSGPTGLAPGQSETVTISNVTGMSGFPGTFLGTYVSSNSFSIPVNTTGAGAYTGGGAVEGGDLGQIDALIQRTVVPSGQTAVTVSALALPIAIVATVAVPQAFVATYQISAPLQINVQLASYAVGGNPPSFAVAYNDIVGALEEAGVLTLGGASYVRQVVSLSINGLATGVGVPFPTNQYKAILSRLTLSVVGV